MRTVFFAAALVFSRAALADNIFEAARKPGQTVVVTLGDQPPTAGDLGKPAMLRRVLGVIAELKGRQISELVECVDSKPAPMPAAGEIRVCVVHIGVGAQDRAIAIEQQPDGAYIAETLRGPVSPGAAHPGSTTTAGADPAPRRSLLKRERVDHLLSVGDSYLGGFGEAAAREPRAEVFDVPTPYVIGAATLDAKTLHERIGASGYIRYDPTSRDLAKERLRARLPAGYAPEHPAGLVVWIDASPDGRPPQPLFKALDQYGMICIGAAGAGNERGVTDRLQLALDAAATAERRWHVDPERVYVAGISGGGKMASILGMCFPDVFGGAVAIVGLGSWETVPTGEGGKVWPAEFTLPKGKVWELLKDRRLAVVTGERDFNHRQITLTLDRIKADRPEIKLFDIAGLGHEFPSPDRLAEEVGWVDERGAADAKQRETDAASALAAAGDTPSEADLLRIVERWPWTAAAWKAAKTLSK